MSKRKDLNCVAKAKVLDTTTAAKSDWNNKGTSRPGNGKAKDPGRVRTNMDRIRQTSRKAHGEDTSVERLVHARKEKERVSGMLQEGYWQFQQRKKADEAKRAHPPAKKNEDRIKRKVDNFCKLFRKRNRGIVNNRKYSTRPKEEIPQTKEQPSPPAQTELVGESSPPRTLNIANRENPTTNEEDQPMLFIELNIGKGITEKVLMYEDEDPQGVIDMIAAKHGIRLS